MKCQGKHEPDHTCTRNEKHIGDHWCHCGKRWPVERPMGTLQLVGDVLSLDVQGFAPEFGRGQKRKVTLTFGAIQEMSLIADPHLREHFKETEDIHVTVTIEYW